MKPDFWDIAESSIETLNKIALRKKFQMGETVFMEGDSQAGFYVVETGKIKIYNLNMEGKELILHFASKGDLLAAPAIFFHTSKFPASSEAIEPSTLWYFDLNQFRSFLKLNPDFMFQFVTLLMRYIVFLKNKTASMVLDQVKDRLIQFLKESGAEENFIDLPIQKNQIALLLGTTPESLSRNLTVLVKEGSLLMKEGKYMLQKKKKQE